MPRSTKHVIFVVGILVVVTVLRNLHIVVDRAASVIITNEHQDKNDEPRMISTNFSHLMEESSQMPNRVIYRAEFGLGHRLLRTAAAFHLAQHLGVAKVGFQWNKCEDHASGNHNDNDDDGSKKKNGTAIFPYLFGKDEWWLPGFQRTHQRGRTILVRTDVLGYLPAQPFVDHQIPLEKRSYKNET